MSTSSGEPVSPRIFAPSSLSFDDSQLCFNKNHFGRPDFNVQRFMNLARRRAGLKQIQQDLRLYLKSVQHSMIELINDDYADFVHLSSNLVSLQSAIDKIESDMNTIWAEFESSTSDAVRTAERVESFCVELSGNRSSQIELRHRIAFLSAVQRLSNLMKNIPETVSSLWLEKVSSCLVDASSYKENLAKDSRECKMFNKLLEKLETILCDEGVRSASGDCSSLPHVLSLLTLADCTDSLTARLVSDLIYPKLVHPSKDHYEMLKAVFAGVNEMRSKWSELLGPKYSGALQAFLDRTLLTFLLTFIDKCMGTVAVPSNTALFHRCFTATQKFIESWPSHSHSRSMLKAVRDKFNLVVYFKLVTHKLVRQVDSEMAPESLKFVDDATVRQPLGCTYLRIMTRFRATMKAYYVPVSSTILKTVETVWAEDVFLYPIADKLWDLTLRLLEKHLAWARALLEAAKSKDASQLGGVEPWQALLAARCDLNVLHSRIFDMALEQLWPKLSDMGVDTSLFGQCLTRFGILADAECAKIDQEIVNLVSSTLSKEFDAVSDVPKQYRWTKKPSPTTHSQYITAAHSKLDELINELSKKNHPSSEELTRSVTRTSYSYLVTKAGEVLDSVDATGSSLSRFKRKGTTLDGTSDDDKIRTQIYRDLSYCHSHGLEKGIEIEGMSKLIDRCRPDTAENGINSNSEKPAVEEQSTAAKESLEEKPATATEESTPVEISQ
ncbi:hypothetical protein OESDEN_12635 [Oesophagostomum dentatum]|uniref:Conserved oligomeric Golgi complex subunit 2 n=1 Tax=Oesophagostomum dentatum TaxID=61180 RepID=A0A0B1SQJ8_OESDE|nr:hypothetical protein OESDEN_12635 [Oesophagostomum dentatum]